VNGSAVSCTEVVADPFPASRNEPAGVHSEVGTRVDQEMPFSESVRNEEAACGCDADMCRHCVSFPAGGRHRAGIFLRHVTEMAVVPPEAGCSSFSEGGSAAWVAVSGDGAGVAGVGTRVPEGGTKVVLLSCECCHLAGEVLVYPAEGWRCQGVDQRSQAPAGVRFRRCGPHRELQSPSCPRAGRRT
jgi:hypothetical protein